MNNRLLKKGGKCWTFIFNIDSSQKNPNYSPTEKNLHVDFDAASGCLVINKKKLIALTEKNCGKVFVIQNDQTVSMLNANCQDVYATIVKQSFKRNMEKSTAYQKANSEEVGAANDIEDIHADQKPRFSGRINTVAVSSSRERLDITLPLDEDVLKEAWVESVFDLTTDAREAKPAN